MTEQCYVMIATQRPSATFTDDIKALFGPWAIADDVAQTDDFFYGAKTVDIRERRLECLVVSVDVADNRLNICHSVWPANARKRKQALGARQTQACASRQGALTYRFQPERFQGITHGIVLAEANQTAGPGGFARIPSRRS